MIEIDQSEQVRTSNQQNHEKTATAKTASCTNKLMILAQEGNTTKKSRLVRIQTPKKQ